MGYRINALPTPEEEPQIDLDEVESNFFRTVARHHLIASIIRHGIIGIAVVCTIVGCAIYCTYVDEAATQCYRKGGVMINGECVKRIPLDPQ